VELSVFFLPDSFHSTYHHLLMTTKTWVVKLEIAIDENSHPRKFIPDAIAECLNLDEGEDIIDYNFVCLD
jgi:hypothetical protein